MADLLGSLLSSMDKPPTVGDKQKKLIQKQRDEHMKREAEEKAKLRKFRDQVEDRINRFIQNPEKQKHKFEPMSKVHRTIIHDVADIAGLTAFSFGEEEVDRYVMVFKKEFAPLDDELAAYRKGEEWDPEKAKAVARQKELAAAALAEQDKESSRGSTPQTDYHEKYEKLLGRESGKDAAKITTPNKQFGFVPSENKRDKRTVEQALADIRAKKQKRADEGNVEEESTEGHSTEKAGDGC
ncbi:sperm-associated antigen 7 homolog [Ixodes scapularis]|nr:sperm-associated antigen 7 homolog [Ixodes scapularis]